MYWTGIGSRKTPEHIQKWMQAIAYIICKQGHTLRSGKADGADLAFQRGLELAYFETKQGSGEIYLPFENWHRQYCSLWDIYVRSPNSIQKSLTIVSKVHGNWKKVRPEYRAYHIRNAFQVMGPRVSEDEVSSFVLFWAPEVDDIVSGGTATAVHLARSLNIPTFNMCGSGPNQLCKFLRRFGVDINEGGLRKAKIAFEALWNKHYDSYAAHGYYDLDCVGGRYQFNSDCLNAVGAERLPGAQYLGKTDVDPVDLFEHWKNNSKLQKEINAQKLTRAATRTLDIYRVVKNKNDYMLRDTVQDRLIRS